MKDKIKEIFEKYENLLKKNYKEKYNNYFIKYYNNITVYDARERYRKAKYKNKELFNDFKEEIIIELDNDDKNSKRERNKIFRNYLSKMKQEISKINEMQYDILKEFISNK